MPPIDPTDPITPPGPSEQQPQANQQLNDVMSQVAQIGREQKAMVGALEEAMSKLPTLQKEIARGFKNMAMELEADLEHITDIREALKSISGFARATKKGIFDTKNFEQAKMAVEKLLEAQKKIQQAAKAGTKEYMESVQAMQMLHKWLKDNERAVGDMNEGEMKKLSNMLHDMVDNTEKIGRNFKAMSVNHLTRSVHSMSKSMAELGIGKDFAAKMDKYVAGAEAKARILEYRKARIEGNVAAAQEKKAQAMEHVRRNAARLGIPLTAGELDMTKGGAARRAVGERMGLGRKALGMFVQGEEGAEVFGAGTGVAARGISAIAGATEGVAGSAAGVMAEAAPVLAIIEVFRELFDKQVQQNKDMEMSLGKAGLFARGGTGFMAARAALTPDTAITRLGLSFERNLKIAQALQEGGRGLTELVTGEGGRPAGEGFGPGGFGQFQRIAVGAGRVAGLTDVEGIQQTLKLLDQYSQTLESSENFFIKVRKGADAAGLSTTKYIAMIDEVNGHFNRMNKNLDQTLNMLSELSKTGRVGAEDLRQYMDFLTAGGPAKGMADVAMNAYAMINESPERQRMREELMQHDMETAMTEAQRAGLTITPDQRRMLQGPNAQTAIQQLDLALANATGLSADEKQSRENAVTSLKRAAGHLARVRAGGGALTQAFGQTFGQTPAEVAMRNQDLLERSIQVSGGTMEEYMRIGPEAFGAKHKAFIGALGQFGLTGDLARQQFEGQTQAATTMLRQFADIREMPEGDERKQAIISARMFLKELNKDPKAKQKWGLTSKTIDELTEDPGKLSDWFKKNGADLAGIAPGMRTTFAFVQRSRMMGREVSPRERAAALEQARQIGIKTQTTGELIANAFSKWFNNLITLTGKIYDFLAGTSDKTRAEAKAVTDTKIFQHALSKTMKSLSDQSAEQLEISSDESKSADEREAAMKKRRDIEDKMARLEEQPQTKEEAEALLREMLGAEGVAGGYTKGANLTDAQVTQNQQIAKDTYDALSSLATSADKKAGTLRFTQDQFRNNPEIGQALMAGALTRTAKDTATGMITYQVNYYSADFTQQTAGQVPANKAPGETPTNPPPSPKPRQ